MDKNLINYTRKELKKGYSIEQIRAVLLKVGYNEKTINEHLTIIKQTPHHYVYAIVCIAIFSFLIISGFIYFYIDPVLKGQRLLEDGRFDDAIIELQKAIEKDPDDARALKGLGFSYLGVGEYGKSETIFNQAINISNESWATYGLALSHYKTGRHSLANFYFEQLFEQEQYNEKSYIYSALVQYKLGQPEKAIERLQEYLRLDPNNPCVSLYIQGIDELHDGNTAMDYFRKASAEECEVADEFLMLEVTIKGNENI